MALTQNQRLALRNSRNPAALAAFFNRQNSSTGGNNRMARNRNQRRRQNTGNLPVVLFNRRSGLVGANIRRNQRNRQRMGGQFNFPNMRMGNSQAPISRNLAINSRETQIQTFTHQTIIATVVNPDAIFSTQIIDFAPIVMPWMRRMAGLFSRYKFRSVQFKYTSNSSTIREGSTWTAVQYFSTENLPSTLAEAQTIEGFTLQPVWQTHPNMHFLKQTNLRDRWYVADPLLKADVDFIDIVNSIPARLLYGTANVPNQQVGTAVGFITAKFIVDFDGLQDMLNFSDVPLKKPSEYFNMGNLVYFNRKVYYYDDEKSTLIEVTNQKVPQPFHHLHYGETNQQKSQLELEVARLASVLDTLVLTEDEN